MTGRTTASPAAPAGVRPRPLLQACSECDALYRHAVLRSGEQARCARCGNLLGRGHRLSPSSLLALSLAAAIVFVIANVQPLVTLSLRGDRVSTTLPGALWATWESGQQAVALLAAAAGFFFPAVVVTLRLFAVAPGTAARWPTSWRLAMRALHFSTRWSMVEVLVLAALVAIVRIAGMAQVIPGPGLFALGTLALLMAALQSAGEHGLWALAEPQR